uniref:CCHC-type domain-containing protein n=1 Tax=Phytophthora ramorum TaxID=164328 RepID=H3GZY1_PHYRM
MENFSCLRWRQDISSFFKWISHSTSQLKTLAEQLDAVGAPVSEDDLVITLLGSLSESYQFLITALESRADSLSWELVTSRLLHEDMKRKEQGGGGVDGAAHGQGQAFMTRDNKRKGRPVKKTGACHNCGKQGHWIAECPSRVQNDAERYRSQRANVAQDEEDSGDYLFSVGRTSSTAKPSDMWLIDSGATQHMTSSNKYMRNYKTMAPVDVHLADDGVVQAVGTGDIVMSMKMPRGMKKGVLTNVWHIPKLSRNLFSVGRFTKDVGPVTFESDGCFADKKGLKWQLGAREGKGLFKLCMTPMMPDEANAASSKDRQGDTTSYLWHLRLGHIGHGGLDAIVKKSYGVVSCRNTQKISLPNGMSPTNNTRFPRESQSTPTRFESVRKMGGIFGRDVLRGLASVTPAEQVERVNAFDTYERELIAHVQGNLQASVAEPKPLWEPLRLYTAEVRVAAPLDRALMARRSPLLNRATAAALHALDASGEDASGTPSAASGSAGASVTVPRSPAATPMAAGEGAEGSSPPTPPSSPGSSPVLAYLLGATPTVVSTPPGSPATHSVSVGCQTDPTDGGLPRSAQAEPSEPSSIERQLLQLGHLVVGVARQRPRRVDSVLDSRLESATDLGEILSAAVAPARLSLAESEEIISLRDEIARLQAQCADSEDRLHAEVQQREKIEVFCTQATSDSNQAMDALRQLRQDHACRLAPRLPRLRRRLLSD